MKVIVLGSQGQLGSEVCKSLASDNNSSIEVLGLTRKEVDLTNLSDVSFEKIKNFAPQVVVNCAAYTQVDKAESESDLAIQINGLALKTLAQWTNQLEAKFLHVSTDFVFSGDKGTPYLETDKCSPLSVYGSSKLKGEELLAAHCENYAVFRTSWLYSKDFPNFYNTMLRLGKERSNLGVVYDQVGTPTTTQSLASALTFYIKEQRNSTQEIFHYSNEGVCSWYDFAHSIFSLNGVEIDLKPIRSEEYPTPAKRPTYSVLDKSKIKGLGLSIPHWQDALRLATQ